MNASISQISHYVKTERENASSLITNNKLLATNHLSKEKFDSEMLNNIEQSGSIIHLQQQIRY